MFWLYRARGFNNMGTMLSAFIGAFAPLATPLGFLWFLHWVGAAVLWRKRQRIGAAVLASLALMMSLVGSRIPVYLVTPLEAPYVRVGLTDVPEADAVVLLGGTHDISKIDPMGFNLKSAADRILTALELIRMKKAGTLVIGGQSQEVDGKVVKEGEVLETWIRRWQIIDAPVINLAEVRDTHDEALQVASLVRKQGWKKIILVTSGSHMRRAEAVFRTTGVNVTPVACDFVRLGTPYHFQFGLFPEARGFEVLDIYLHEKVGWWVYWARGWIR
jgi:uncharacterized SAM-binding protein YcdF (DUF218 family)